MARKTWPELRQKAAVSRYGPAISAIYTPPGGVAVSCHVIDRHSIVPQSEWDEVIHRRLEYGFRLAEATPVRGGTLVVDGQTYTLRELVDDDGLVAWWAVK